MRIISIAIEIAWAYILKMFDMGKDPGYIPCGPYCHTEAGKSCKYYRRTKYYEACVYLPWMGNDVLLNDQCKICGENETYSNN